LEVVMTVVDVVIDECDEHMFAPVPRDTCPICTPAKRQERRGYSLDAATEVLQPNRREVAGMTQKPAVWDPFYQNLTVISRGATQVHVFRGCSRQKIDDLLAHCPNLVLLTAQPTLKPCMLLVLPKLSELGIGISLRRLRS
jgi:hypothetical protein